MHTIANVQLNTEIQNEIFLYISANITYLTSN